MITNQTRSAVDFMQFVKSGATAGQSTLAAGDNTLIRKHKGREVTPTAFEVNTAGLVVLKARDGTRRDVQAATGKIYPCQGIDAEDIVTINGTDTTADIVLFYYSGY